MSNFSVSDTGAKNPKGQPFQRDPIAIVGIGCRFPGGINSPETFWQLLYNEIDTIAQIPSDRFDVDALYDPQPQMPGKIVTRQGGFLEQIDRFDAYFFGIPPREANCLDPQQRLLLELAWEALEDGGQRPDSLAGSQTGVFIGMWTNDYEDIMYNTSDNIDLYVTTGGGRYAASGRLSYFFDFRGPSVTVDSACSSSLVAVHLACQSLWSGESSFALAGGVNLILEPSITIGYSRSGMLSPEAQCKFGDIQANGYVRSEGAGVVALKPLSQALANNDPIYALIRGSAVNNDGRSSGLLVAPGLEAQAAMLRQAYCSAGVSPGQVGYVEAHGTGTKAGDPTELTALGIVLAENRPPDHPCLIGSVKTNIGHTEAASGVAGLIKAALCLKHRAVPASLNLHEPNPGIPWADLPLVIPQKLRPWPEADGPALAGVNSFGVTGTNAHIVLQEAPEPTEALTEMTQINRPYLLPLSAHTPEALYQIAQSYLMFINQHGEDAFLLPDFAYTLALRRPHHNYRLTLVAYNQQDMTEQLSVFLENQGNPGTISNCQKGESSPKIVFVFPGQGSQWLGMGQQLLKSEPIFYQTLAQCEQAMQSFVDWSLLEQLTVAEDSPGYRLDQIDVIQPTLLSIEIALATLWRSWGVEPAAVIGHSMGEVAAAYIAGILTLEEAMRVICRRSQLLRRASGQGGMAVVELSFEEAQAALAGYEGRLSIAVSNSPHSTVLSGDPAALDELIKELEVQEVFCRLIKVDIASHSPQMDRFKTELSDTLMGLQPKVGIVPLYSTSLGIVTDGGGHDTSYWVKNLRQPVLFSKMVQQLLADGHNVFIEISPHTTLLHAIQQGFQFAGKQGITLSSLRRHEDEQTTLLTSLGTLFALGYPIAWEQLYPSGGRCLSLPPYPWQRERYWYEDADKPEQRRRTQGSSHPLLGSHLHLATGAHLWEVELSTALFPYLADHKVRGTTVLPAAVYVEIALAAAAEAFGLGSHSLTDIVFKKALFLPDGDLRQAQLIITAATPGVANFQFFSRTAKMDEPTAWLLHASGTIQLDQAETAAAFPPPADTLRSHIQIAVPGPEHYRLMGNRALQYGPSFQAITQLWQLAKANEVIGELQAPGAIAGGLNGYRLHPSLLDGCFQLLIAALGRTDPSDTYLPLKLDRLELYGQPNMTHPLWGYAIRRSQDQTLSGDIFLLNETGQVIMAVYGLQMQRLAHRVEADIEDWLYELRWQPADAVTPQSQQAQEPGTWLLFAGRQGLGEKLAARLAELGKSPVVVYRGKSYQKLEQGQYQLDPAQPDQLRRLLKEALPEQASAWQSIVHLWGLEAEPPVDITLATLDTAQELGGGTLLHLIQALNSLRLPASPHLWLVTSGSQTVGTPGETLKLSLSTLWGLGGVIVNEHPELRCKRIDLSPAVSHQDLEALWTELWSDSPEDQVAFRHGRRYVARLARYAPKALASKTVETHQVKAQPGQAYQLAIPTPGILDDFILRSVPRCAPEPGQVEIEVRAAGLNFIDVMKAMGLYPGLDPAAVVGLGGECAGQIVGVGEGVDKFKAGDEIIALNPALNTLSFFSNYVTVPVELVVPKPAHLSFEEAATIPINFLTAYYALLRLGRLEQGERVLIHSASGGVGLAAIQLAQLVGAEIFATAGNPEKRTYLRQLGIRHVMDSRSLAFAGEALDQTNGQGVDLVLNSLAGEAIQKSLAALGPYGRFLEIGKRDIYQNSPIGLEPFKKNLAFFAIDLARMIKERPAQVGSLFREVMEYFEAQRLQPLPLKPFPISEAGEAFRYMAQAHHIGKIVLSLQEQVVTLTEPAPKSTPVRSDGTYLVTGGLGGLGLSVAHWLAEQGAGHLVLLGRSRPSTTAQAVINNIKRMGTGVTVAGADVSQTKAVAEVLNQIKETLPPLRGVIHAAGILDDSILLQLDREKFKRVLAPKLQGAWNLHVLTQPASLDFFILFSSITTLLGSPGQGNYVAANAFLDGLAHHRRAQGQPALSINWGPWAEVGLAAQSNRGQRLALQGIGSITPEQGIAALSLLLQQESAQVGVMPFDLQQWLEYTSPAGQIPFFSELQRDEPVGRPRRPQSNLREALLAAEPGQQRRSLLEAYLREQVAQVLRLTPARIPLNKPLKTLGLDSLMTLELRNRLEVGLDLTLSATLIFNYPTLEALIPYLAEKMAIPLVAVASTGEGTTVEVEPPSRLKKDLDNLSQESIEAMLSEELTAIDDLLKEV